MKRILILILMIILIFSVTACKSKNNDSTRITVSSYTKQLYDNKNQYIGDHIADLKILELLSIKDELGSYQMELQTNQEPYIIKLNFKDTVEKRNEFDLKMQKNSFLILALIDNAGGVQWTYSLHEEEDLITVYANGKDAKEILGKDIKEFGKSEVQLQELLGKLEINNTDNESNYKKNIVVEPKEPEISLKQTGGADMVQLDYASDDTIIFHGYFGLFVYNIKEAKMIRSVDLKAINCSDTQGDNYCEVSVNNDGTIVQLHAISSEDMYIYSTLDNTLVKSDYKPMENSFKIVPTVDEIKENSFSYSAESVKFDNGDLGYLFSEDCTLGTLKYICNDKDYTIFSEESSF